MEALGFGGYLPQSVKSKADAMKYAFDLTTVRNLSTGENQVNMEKALEVYKAFTDNIELPNVEKNISEDLLEMYKRISTSYKQDNHN